MFSGITGRNLRSLQQSMAARTHRLAAIPFQKRLRRTADANRVRQQPEAHRTAAPLIPQDQRKSRTYAAKNRSETNGMSITATTTSVHCKIGGTSAIFSARKIQLRTVFGRSIGRQLPGESPIMRAPPARQQ